MKIVIEPRIAKTIWINEVEIEASGFSAEWNSVYFNSLPVCCVEFLWSKKIKERIVYQEPNAASPKSKVSAESYRGKRYRLIDKSGEFLKIAEQTNESQDEGSDGPTIVHDPLGWVKLHDESGKLQLWY